MIVSWCCFLSLFLFVCFETDGLIEYSKLLKLTFLLPRFLEYKNIIYSGGKINYLQYLNKSDQRFWVKIISCPICLSIYLSLISILFVGIIGWPVVNMFGLIGYFILKILSVK